MPTKNSSIIRIIGGKYCGRKIYFPVVAGLRPTPNKVRETLFNWLMHDLTDARCLDVFAGSGALGFEAYSRGASRVVLVESANIAVVSLQRFAAQLTATNLLVVHMDACRYLRETTESFDIIFLDPPFAKNYLPQALAILAQRHILSPGGLIYIESCNKILVDFKGWRELKSKHTGQVFYSLYENIGPT